MSHIEGFKRGLSSGEPAKAEEPELAKIRANVNSISFDMESPCRGLMAREFWDLKLFS
jgi:hypothetical protein